MESCILLFRYYIVQAVRRGNQPTRDPGIDSDNVRDRHEEERALVARAKDGDDNAFQELVVRYETDVFRVAYLILRDAAEAEDAAQEAFLRAHRSIRRFDEERPFRPWVLKIASNQALSMLRRFRRRTEPLTGPVAATPSYSIDDTLIDRERVSLLLAALNRMREQERVVVYLRYFMDFSERELAEYMECAQGTVKSRLHRALRRLREIVERDFPQLMEEGA